MTAADFERLLEWLLFPCIPMLYGLAVLWILTPVEEPVALIFVGFQADPAGTTP